MTAAPSYHRYNRSTPVHGMGSDDVPQVTFADEVLREMLQARPVGSFAAWAEQIGDTAWDDKIPAEFMYTAVPVDQDALNQVKQASFGHELPYVAMLLPRPATLNAIDRELHGTPYKRDVSLAVYDLKNESQIPQILFLVYARHRDTLPFDQQGGGGNRSVQGSAERLGGRLVYVMQAPLPPHRRPTVGFQDALNNQLGIRDRPPVKDPPVELPPDPPVITAKAPPPQVQKKRPATKSPVVATKEQQTGASRAVKIGALVALGALASVYVVLAIRNAKRDKVPSTVRYGSPDTVRSA